MEHREQPSGLDISIEIDDIDEQFKKKVAPEKIVTDLLGIRTNIEKQDPAAYQRIVAHALARAMENGVTLEGLTDAKFAKADAATPPSATPEPSTIKDLDPRLKAKMDTLYKEYGEDGITRAIKSAPTKKAKKALEAYAQILLGEYGDVIPAPAETPEPEAVPTLDAASESSTIDTADETAPAIAKAESSRTRAKESLTRVPEAYFVFPDDGGKFHVWQWQDQENLDEDPDKTRVTLPQEALDQLKEEPEYATELTKLVNETRDRWNSDKSLGYDMTGIAQLKRSIKGKEGDELIAAYQEFLAEPKRRKITFSYDEPQPGKTNEVVPVDEEIAFSDDQAKIANFEALPLSALQGIVERMPSSLRPSDWKKWGETTLRLAVIDFLISRDLHDALSSERLHMVAKPEQSPKREEPKQESEPTKAPASAPAQEKPRAKTEGAALVKKLAHSAFELQTFSEDPATADIAAVTRGMIDKVRVMVQGRDKPQYDADAVRAVARESFLSAGRDAAEVDTALAEVFGEKTSDTSASTQEKSPTLESSKFDRTDLRAMSAALEQTLVAIPGMSSVLERIPGDPRESIPGLREKVLAHFAKIFSRDLDQLAAQGATDAVRASATKLRDALGGAGIRFDAAKGAFEVTDARRFALLIRAEQRHLIEKGSV